MQDVDPKYLIAQPVEFGGVPRPRLLLREVYRVYAGRFRRWLAITAPTSLLASIVLLMADRKISEIYRSFPITQISYHMLEVAEAGVLRYGSFFISWFLGCFALAAIATVADGFDRGEIDDVWLSDSFQRAREHLGSVFIIAFVTFGLYLSGMAVMEFIIFAMFRVVGRQHFLRFNYGASFVAVVVISSIVSWIGMAIPLILSENIGAWAALKKSLKISSGYEVFLSLLVCESLIGSYVAWYAVHYGLTFLFPTQLRYTEWFGWLVYFITILASAAVQPPMFIGFSLLATEGNTNSLPLPHAQQPPHVD
jgi:hypothetical protein